jgi:hypothetical protein
MDIKWLLTVALICTSRLGWEIQQLITNYVNFFHELIDYLLQRNIKYFPHSIFTMVKYIQHKIVHFQVYNSATLETFTLLYNHLQYPFPGLFHYPKLELSISPSH